MTGTKSTFIFGFSSSDIKRDLYEYFCLIERILTNNIVAIPKSKIR